MSYADGWTIGIYEGAFAAGVLTWHLLSFAIPAVSYAAAEGVAAAQILHDSERGFLYLAYSELNRLSGPFLESTIRVVRSIDGGITWSAPLSLSGNSAYGSRAALGPDGELLVVWADYGACLVVGRRSVDFAASFEPPFVVGEMRDNIGTPPPGWWEDLSRNHPGYPVTISTGALNLPWIAVDRSSGPDRGQAYVTWTDYATGTVQPATGSAYDTDPNNTLAEAQPVNVGDEIFGYIPSADVDPIIDTDVYTFVGRAGTTLWMDGEIFGVERPWALGFGVICQDAAGGFQYVARGQVDETYPQPPVIYTLPVDGRYYLTLPGSGPVAYYYVLRVREYAVDSGSVSRDHRDVVLTSSGDGGATWSPKMRLNDEPAGFDDAYPALDVDGNGVVHVAWYDRRLAVGCPNRVDTYWRWSSDGGRSFTPSQRVSEHSSVADDPTIPFWRVGDHLEVKAVGGRTLVLWTQVDPGEVDVYGAWIEEIPTATVVERLWGEVVGDRVRLRWVLGRTEGVEGFEVHRAEGEQGSFRMIARLEWRGDPEVRHEDRAVETGRLYRYRVRVMMSGGDVWSEEIRVAVGSVPARLALSAPRPNPAAGRVALTVESPRAGRLRVMVYDAAGRRRAMLADRDVLAGTTGLGWTGLDAEGRLAPPGLYFVEAMLGEEKVTRRLVRAR